MAEPAAPGTLSEAVKAHRAGDTARAEAIYRALVEADPPSSFAAWNLGIMLRKRGDIDAGLGLFASLAERAPEDGRIRFQYAELLYMAGGASQALPHYQAATRLLPDEAVVFVSYARSLLADRRSSLAADAARHAIVLAPGDARAWFNYGLALERVADPADADAANARALRLDPHYLRAAYARLRKASQSADIELTEELAGQIAASLRWGVWQGETDWKIFGNLGYLALFGYFDDASERRIAETITALFPPSRPIRRPAPQGGRLRVGYLSAHFGAHPIGHVTQGLFAAHDRAGFEVFGYSQEDRTGEEADYGRTIRDGFEHFCQLEGTVRERAERIAADRLDVLVDLDGLMSFSAQEILAMRPAAVQVFWLGHAGVPPTLVHDYVIADRVVWPERSTGRDARAVVYMPSSYHVATPHAVAPRCPSRVEYGLRPDAFIFGAFNNPQKIDRATFSLWMQVLAMAPGSQLWLSGGIAADKLRQAAAAAGVDPDRLVFAGREADKAVHLKRHDHIDLFLDALQLNASTTALDALWVGTPLVTMPGQRFGSRIATSFLTALGLPELICQTPEIYVQTAASLAADLPALMSVRMRLADAVQASDLFKVDLFARRIESAFTTMVDRHRGAMVPASFEVGA